MKIEAVERVDSVRKKIFSLFEELGFNITVERDLKTVEYINDKLNLNIGTVEPYKRKMVFNDMSISSETTPGRLLIRYL